MNDNRVMCYWGLWSCGHNEKLKCDELTADAGRMDRLEG